MQKLRNGAIHCFISQSSALKRRIRPPTLNSCTTISLQMVWLQKERSSILLSTCGAATFKLVRILVSSVEIETTSYSEIVHVLKDHFDPVVCYHAESVQNMKLHYVS